jgi:hypothetical protein
MRLLLHFIKFYQSNVFRYSRWNWKNIFIELDHDLFNNSFAMAKIRSEKKDATAVASSGIARLR